RPEFDANTRAEYARLRDQHEARTREKKLLTLGEARADRKPIDWSGYVPPRPDFLGVRVYASDGGTISVSSQISGNRRSAPSQLSDFEPLRMAHDASSSGASKTALEAC